MTRSRKKIAVTTGPVRSAGTVRDLWQAFEAGIDARDATAAAQAIHELWMRGEIGANVERALEQLWRVAAKDVPDWLPMRHVDWLPRVYEISGRFQPARRGRSNVYLVLLDYSDSRTNPFGIYVGMSHYPPAQRFEQHKAGIRAAGSVLQRGIEVLAGPTLHLQQIARVEAARIEEELAEALRDAGLFVQGGH